MNDKKIKCFLNKDAIKKIYIPKNSDRKQSFSSSPQSNQFCLIPKYNPELKNYVEYVYWDVLNKTLDIQIAETPCFSTYEWIVGVKKRSNEIKKSPFCDLEKDALGLCLFDEKGICVARMKFVGLEIIKHNCQMDTERGLEPLTHHIKLNYEEIEMLKNIESNSNEENEDIDDEWM